VKQTSQLGSTSGTLSAHILYYENKYNDINNHFNEYKTLLLEALHQEQEVNKTLTTGFNIFLVWKIN
jgi:hypothetical protein